MDSIFNENYYYWCPFCEEYSMDLIVQDERDYIIHKTFECVLCGEKIFNSICID